MAKQVLTLNDFSGGINDVRDPRDIAMNQLSFAQNVAVDQQGALRTIGAVAAHSTIEDSSTIVSAGYGIAYVEADVPFYATVQAGDDTGGVHAIIWDRTNDELELTGDNNDWAEDIPLGSKLWASGGNAIGTIPRTVKALYTTGSIHNYTYHVVFKETLKGSGDIAESGDITVYYLPPKVASLLVANATVATGSANNATIKVWQSDTENFVGTDPIIINTEDYHESPKMVYYVVNGAVRCIDTNFDNQSKIKWYGFIDRIHFDEDDGDIFFGFYSNDNVLTPPTQADEGLAYPGAGTGFEIDLTDSGNTGDGLWEAEEYEIAASFIYDGNQESLLFSEAGGVFTPAGDKRLSVKIFAQGSYDERIIGGRVYIRKSNSIGNIDDEWSMLADIDFQRGVRGSFNDSFTVWTSVGSNKQFHSTVILDAPNFDTYTSIIGYSSDEYFNDFGDEGETAASGIIANNRAFLGNVRVKNPASDNLEYFGDRIMFSPSGKYDTFPESFNIDVVKGDADSYVRLESFADRLLGYKNKSLQIINIAAKDPSGWFLEENLQRLGVVHHNAVYRTDYGVIWANEYGCYLYDGKIRNLTENKIDDDTWKSHVTSNTILGYDPVKKQCFVVDDSSASLQDVYVYDFKTKSWVLGKDIFGDGVIMTNIIVDDNNDMIFGSGTGTTAYKKWSNSSASNSDIELKTKDIDFGDPSLIKKIYEVKITYQSSAEQQNPLQFAINGTGGFSSFSTGSNITPEGNSGGAGYLESSTTWDVANFVADSIQSCQSIQFKLDLGSGTFNINDMSIVYRPIKGKYVS